MRWFFVKVIPMRHSLFWAFEWNRTEPYYGVSTVFYWKYIIKYDFMGHLLHFLNFSIIFRSFGILESPRLKYKYHINIPASVRSLILFCGMGYLSKNSGSYESSRHFPVIGDLRHRKTKNCLPKLSQCISFGRSPHKISDDSANQRRP